MSQEVELESSSAFVEHDNGDARSLLFGEAEVDMQHPFPFGSSVVVYSDDDSNSQLVATSEEESRIEVEEEVLPALPKRLAAAATGRAPMSLAALLGSAAEQYDSPPDSLAAAAPEVIVSTPTQLQQSAPATPTTDVFAARRLSMGTLLQASMSCLQLETQLLSEQQQAAAAAHRVTADAALLDALEEERRRGDAHRANADSAQASLHEALLAADTAQQQAAALSTRVATAEQAAAAAAALAAHRLAQLTSAQEALAEAESAAAAAVAGLQRELQSGAERARRLESEVQQERGLVRGLKQALEAMRTQQAELVEEVSSCSVCSRFCEITESQRGSVVAVLTVPCRTKGHHLYMLLYVDSMHCQPVLHYVWRPCTCLNYIMCGPTYCYTSCSRIGQQRAQKQHRHSCVTSELRWQHKSDVADSKSVICKLH
jgi:hypothetical protein